MIFTDVLDLKDISVENQNNPNSLIHCKQCGVDKPKRDFRKVANPDTCLDCYKRNRRESKMVREGTRAENGRKWNLPRLGEV